MLNSFSPHREMEEYPMIRFRDQERQELEACYQETRNRKVHIVLLRAKGIKRKALVEMFGINKQTVTNYCHLYKQQGLKGLLVNHYKGRRPYLIPEQIEEVRVYIDSNLCKVKDVHRFIEEHFGVSYSSGGISDFVRRLGYRRKKTKRRPGKADPVAQKKFVEDFSDFLDHLGEEEELGFLDESGFVHNSVPAYVLGKPGEPKYIASNSGREKLKGVGWVTLDHLDVQVYYTEGTIDSLLMKEVLTRLDRQLTVSKLHLFLDEAPFHQPLKSVSFEKIELHFLPTYSPNLNLMERIWDFAKDKLLANKYYELFKTFKEAFCEFFRTLIERDAEELQSRITPKFQIVK